MNEQLTTAIKAIRDSIGLLSIYINEQPTTIEDAQRIYKAYYIGGLTDNEPTAEEYITRLYKECGLMQKCMYKPKEKLKRYEESFIIIFRDAQRAGLSDPKKRAYIQTSKDNTPKDMREWKNRYIHGLFIKVCMILTNLQSKLGAAEQKETRPDPKSEINEEELSKYFVLSFKGGGNNPNRIDYFHDYLLPDLKSKRSNKDYAKIALLIYNSGKMLPSMKPETFKAWYQTFCKLIGCKYVANYHKCKLTADEQFKSLFPYL